MTNCDMQFIEKTLGQIMLLVSHELSDEDLNFKIGIH